MITLLWCVAAFGLVYGLIYHRPARVIALVIVGTVTVLAVGIYLVNWYITPKEKAAVEVTDDVPPLRPRPTHG